MNNQEFMHNYMYNTDNEARKHFGNLSYKGFDLYSYTTQIARIYPEFHLVIISFYDYSKTTINHKRLLLNAIPSNYGVIYTKEEFNIELYTKKMEESIKEYYEYKTYKNGALTLYDFRANVIKHYNDLKTYNEYVDNNYKIPEDIVTFAENQINYENIRQEREVKKREAERERRVNDFLTVYGPFYEKVSKYYEENLKSIENVSIHHKVSLLVSCFREEFYTISRSKVDNYYYYLKFFENIVFGLELKDFMIYPYDRNDYMWIQNNILNTNNSVRFELSLQVVLSLCKFIILYNKKEYDKLIGKHIHTFTILEANDDYVQVGCHRFPKMSIDDLHNQLKNINLM